MPPSSLDVAFGFRRFWQRVTLVLLIGLGAIGPVCAQDRTPVLEVIGLDENVYALIGPTTNRSPENLGNNANFGVIVTETGVVLIDPGATYKGARMIHEAVRSISDLPVTLVINTGGQDHRWLGNGYFKSLGARIIANENAVVDQETRLDEQLSRLRGLAGDEALEGTSPVYADDTFSEHEVLEVGGVRIELHHAGHAHTPGDSYVWLPDHGILFSGDIVYVDRMLNVGPQSAHRSWIAAFESLAARQPRVLVPGHGRPADLDKATRDTYRYLVFLRESVQSLLDQGRGMETVGEIDQSAFAYLENYDSLKGRNAQRVYEEMEWE
jgi:glyoxylase-like metal-dependent hydrolase (beta-lactamase superfamily II)